MLRNEQTFDVFRTADKTVSKYIHEDGSETAIKKVKSTQNVINPITSQIETIESDRNKYSVFISCSVGCHMACKFCHLTLKGAKHYKLESDQVLNNLKEALEDQVAFDPEIKSKYIKLSWMGMGDAINKPEMVRDVTLRFLDWVFENGYAKGLDGIDLSTVMPKIKKPEFIGIFHNLENDLRQYPLNEKYSMDNHEFRNFEYTRKNVFRLFYSVESAIQEKRENVIPNAMPLVDAANLLNQYQASGSTLIFHHLLVEGLNDSEEELSALIHFMKKDFDQNELRILRYNYCSKSDYKESEKFISQIKSLSNNINKLKVQVSPGTEVSAACGQFIVKDFVRIKR
jgi:adenine C2-methylase RlmN of 23S rRNA A2503 and tRNA A37